MCHPEGSLSDLKDLHRGKRGYSQRTNHLSERAKQGGQDHGDLLSMLLNAVDEKSGGGRLDDQQVRNEAMTLMLAGHDTTAAAMNWLWFNLAQYPDVAEVSGCAGINRFGIENESFLRRRVSHSFRPSAEEQFR